jgi:hypothetical protein
MCRLPNMTKSDLAEPSQCKKRKLKKTNVNIDEWAAFEWTCVDSPQAR